MATVQKKRACTRDVHYACRLTSDGPVSATDYSLALPFN